MKSYCEQKINRPLVCSALLGVLVGLYFLNQNFLNRKESPVLSETPNHQNRLIHEKSPYLLQHAHNPVDWYPWGEEAFEMARKEDKPIFLSIGYSTCHWCHVMEKESFEDSQVAALMNKTFINIKVDREERPDIDGVYMTVCQMLTGSGGWPMTILMTPDKKPFFAGTYFPRESRYGRIGMLDLCPRVKEMWESRREELLESAEKIVVALSANIDPQPGQTTLNTAILKETYQELSSRFDPRHGGFGHAPKFPTPHNLMFLLRYWKRSGDSRALEMVETTLQQMRRGGIFDQIGFGFHRYSTDPVWLVPHFEKMLYDQALLAMAYSEAYQATGNDLYKKTAQEVFTYVLRDMTAPQGGFYSAEDADSEGEEGKFYLWRQADLEKILGTADADFFCRVFNTEEDGNFQPEVGGAGNENIPHLNKSEEQLSAILNLSPDQFRQRLEQVRQKLFEVREKRIHPHKDDKILTDWNGLMIAALAKSAQALNEPQYALAASRATEFIQQNLMTSDGNLLHRYRDGQAGITGNVDDYAFLIWGLIELYQATFEIRHLQSALRLQEKMINHFWDAEQGGFYFTSDRAEALIVRQKEIYDGAVPSGNSVAAWNLIRLSRITGNPDYESKAQAIGCLFSTRVSQSPSAYTLLMMAVDYYLGPSYEVVISGKPEAQDTGALLDALRRVFLPNQVTLLRPSDPESKELFRIAPFTQGQTPLNGQATAYVCINQACHLPVTNPEEMIKLLGANTGTRPVPEANAPSGQK